MGMGLNFGKPSFLLVIHSAQHCSFYSHLKKLQPCPFLYDYRTLSEKQLSSFEN